MIYATVSRYIVHANSREEVAYIVTSFNKIVFKLTHSEAYGETVGKKYISEMIFITIDNDSL